MNNLRERISAGEWVAGTMMRIVRNPAAVYLAKNAGLDFIMYDTEHSYFNFETLHDVFATGNALGIAMMVRVPELSKDNISRMLDAGAIGLMVPMIETTEQAKILVKYSKYQPIGGRGFTAVGAHTAYTGGKHIEIMEEANKKVLSIAQIETKLAVENAGEIASVEGIDALLIGPNDLSISLGIPGDLTNQIELDAITKVAAACKTHKKFFALHAAPILTDLFVKDLSFVMQGAEIDFLLNGYKAVKAYANSLPSHK